MFCVKSSPVLKRTGPERIPFKWLLSSRRLRSTSAGAHRTSVDFEETREVYKSKDSLELLRSLVVFKLCSFDILVDKNKEIMDLGKTILGQRAFSQFMKMTFYGQFVAGEDHKAIRPLIQKNRAFGVGSVLDYSVEEDISQEDSEHDLEVNSSIDDTICWLGLGPLVLDWLAGENF